MHIILNKLVHRYNQLTKMFLFTAIDLKIEPLIIATWNLNVIQIMLTEKNVLFGL